MYFATPYEEISKQLKQLCHNLQRISINSTNIHSMPPVCSLAPTFLLGPQEPPTVVANATKVSILYENSSIRGQRAVLQGGASSVYYQQCKQQLQCPSLSTLELFFNAKSLEGQSANIAEATQTLEKVMKGAKWNDPANAVILL
jgi:hypothetical protein